MEVILLKDIANLGLANSIAKVKPGYARNYLIPQGMAIEASKRNTNMLQQKIQQHKERASKMLEESKELAVKLTSTTFQVAAKAGTSGKIFGSVTNVQVAQTIKETLGIEIERKYIALLEEVKMLGTYTAKIQLHPEVAATVSFNVFDEK